MRLTILIALLGAIPTLALAQEPEASNGAEAPDGAAPESEGSLTLSTDTDAAPTGGGLSEQLEAPSLSMPDLSMPDVELPPEEVAEEAVEEETEAAEAPEPIVEDATADLWRPPSSVMSFRGYLRLRGLIWNGYGLGRERAEDPGAFRYFRVADRDVVPRGGCGGTPNPDPNEEMGGPDSCGNSDHHRFASMRLRLRPTLSLSDSVRVHATIDVFDNLVLGSTPSTEVYIPPSNGEEDQFVRGRAPGWEQEILHDTQNPSQALRNSSRDSIVMRRAWAEITNPGIGQLRFGRMGSHWGLGMMQNAGNDLDGDYSTDVDRILVATRAFGLSGFVAWDFADQGIQRAASNDLRGVPFDATNIDDQRQISAALAWRTEEAIAQQRLRDGGYVLDIGAYFIARRHAYASTVTNAFPSPADYNSTRSEAYVRRDARIYTPDLWVRFRMGGLRLELEAAMQVGEIGSAATSYEEGNPTAEDPYRLLSFGLAFEGEYRLPQLDNKLYIRLYTGLATGDGDLRGMSWNDDNQLGEGANRTLSQYTFHPNYRIDLILWRNIMGRVAGAWYLKPGLGYDIIRNERGRLFGVSADVIYSRAMVQAQTYGDDPNLGVELNLAAYYRSEDGPGFLDGFYASFQYGVLFPMQGLGYTTVNNVPEVAGGNPDLPNAQSLRLLLGVQY